MRVRRELLGALAAAAVTVVLPLAVHAVEPCDGRVVPPEGPTWLASVLPESTEDGCRLAGLSAEVFQLTLGYRTGDDRVVEVRVGPAACAGPDWERHGEVAWAGLAQLKPVCPAAAGALGARLAGDELGDRLFRRLDPQKWRPESGQKRRAPIPEVRIQGFLEPRHLPTLAASAGACLVCIGLGWWLLRRGRRSG